MWTRGTWTRLLLVTLCAALAFGGTFTCRSDNDSDDFTERPTTGVPK